MSDIEKLQNRLGIRFSKEELLKEALTHKSFSAEHNIVYDNQRLELLGDAVVQIILTRYLFDLYPDLQEGDLTKLRASLANQESLAEVGRSFDLGSYLLMGKGELELHGSDRESTVSDACEAFLGALYLDHGLDFTEKFLLDICRKQHPDPLKELSEQNPKGALQEWTQQRGQGVPVYKLISVSGPDHEPIHEVEVYVKNEAVSRGRAASRKMAERNAAKEALEILKSQENTKEPQK